MTTIGPQPAATPVVVMASPEPNLLIRVIWFIFIGWWLSQLVLLLGWLLNLTILLIPAGVFVLNRIPQAATLKSSRKALRVRVDEETGVQVVEMVDREQLPMWQRAVYFLLVGWWASLIWLELAWLFGVLIVTLPLSFWMFGATGKVTTLRR
jgi:uncharacterized membrane protein YccF (DUF307 family)